MRNIKLTKEEKAVENALLKGEYASVSKKEFNEIAEALTARKKDAVLNMRISSADMKGLKQKAKKLGVKYQSFIAEVLHRVARV